MSFARDYETKGQPLIRLGGFTGAVNATAENFNMTAEQIAQDETFIDRNKAESGVFCLYMYRMNWTFLFENNILAYLAIIYI